MSLLTIKYAPQHSSEIIGQDLAVSQLKDFILHHQQKKQNAALLSGPIGVGKTSSVYALAQELNYDLLELNSSDLRNAAAIHTFLGSALGQQSLFFRPKIILIDEIDALSGTNDRGCIPALVKALEKAAFPVILTANDLYDDKLKALRKICLEIVFPKVDHQSIFFLLQLIAAKEHFSSEESALRSLARQVDGDVRAALLDLQITSANGPVTFAAVTQLSDRKRTASILQALSLIFKSSTIENALPALEDIAVDLDEVFLWLDENLPREYTSSLALARAYEHLARADVFRGRIKRQQHWRFLVYINNLLTAGISSAKEERNPKFTEYKRTMRLLKIWQANQKYARRKEIAAKIARKIHTSRQSVVAQFPYYQAIFAGSAQTELIREWELTEEEAEWLGQ
ncbi:replication factor C large subunit [Candidatus Woesearchaeota archaeon]|nr:replication factor C large subunit [Candidatus Woesearchaeota archaeon]